jgi:hypothetical protein
MSEEQIKMNYINDIYNMKIYIKLGTKTFQNAFGPKCFWTKMLSRRHRYDMVTQRWEYPNKL